MSVIAEGSVESVQDVVADVTPSQGDVAMTDEPADQSSTLGVTDVPQESDLVQDLRQITVVKPSFGRVGVEDTSATVLFGDEGIRLQLRNIPTDPSLWTALEWVIKAGPS